MVLNNRGRRREWGNVIVVAIFVLLFGGIAVVFLVSARHAIEKERLVASDPVHTTAVIVEVVKHWHEHTSSTYSPRVEFETESGTAQVLLTSSSVPTEYLVGDELAITYQAGNPKTAIETSRRGEVANVMILPVVFGAIAIAILLFALTMWAATVRGARRQREIVVT